MKTELDRRQFMAGLLALTLVLVPGAALAKDGESGSSGSGGGGGDDSGGDDNSGGSGNSGSDDKDDDRDDDKDDDRDDDNGGGSSKGKRDKDQERALRAVNDGDVASLQKLRAHLKAKYPGKVLHVDLKRQMGRYVYKIKLLEKGNRVKSLTLDGKTLQSRIF